MLSLFLLHIFITILSFFSGFLFYYFISKDNKTANEYKPVIFYLVTGLIGLTIILQITVLFAPINKYFQVIFLVLFAILSLLVRKPLAAFARHLLNEIKRQPPLAIITFLTLWLLVLILNAGPTQMDDTESYHLQAINWIKEYGTVPGLVHLHERFAFNSSWFSTISFFDISFNHLNFYTALNGTLSLWLAGYFIGLLNGKGNSLFFAGLLLFLVALFSWPLIRGNATNTNYDYITAVVVFVLFIETVRNAGTIKKKILTAEWMIWPAYLVTVRIINFPLLLLSVFAFFSLLNRKEYTKILTYTLISLALIIPFLVRNIILSGYLFYPSLSFDWFTPDWKADPRKTKELLRFIKYFNRVNTGIWPLEKTESLGFFQWIKAWMQFMFTYDKIIFIPGIAGFLIFPLVMKRINFFLPVPVRFFTGVIALNIIIWFFIAPDPRFIYGGLLIGLSLLAISLTQILHIPDFTRLSFVSLFFIFITTAGFTVSKIITTKKFPDLLYPYSLPSPPLRTISAGRIQLYIPDKILNNWNPRCYDTKLPCLYEVDPNLQARGTTIEDGFKLKN
jgi:hypothetical protein